jgi:hypothetical protein
MDCVRIVAKSDQYNIPSDLFNTLFTVETQNLIKSKTDIFSQLVPKFIKVTYKYNGIQFEYVNNNDIIQAILCNNTVKFKVITKKNVLYQEKENIIYILEGNPKHIDWILNDNSKIKLEFSLSDVIDMIDGIKYLIDEIIDIIKEFVRSSG